VGENCSPQHIINLFVAATKGSQYHLHKPQHIFDLFDYREEDMTFFMELPFDYKHNENLSNLEKCLLPTLKNRTHEINRLAVF